MKKILLIGSGILAKEFKKSVSQKWLFYVESSQIMKEFSSSQSITRYLHSITKDANPFIIINSMHTEFEKNYNMAKLNNLTTSYVKDLINYVTYKNLPIVNVFQMTNFSDGVFYDFKENISEITKLYSNYKKCINLEADYVYSKYDNENLIKKIESALYFKSEIFSLQKKKVNMIEIEELYDSIKDIVENIYKNEVQFQKNSNVKFDSYKLASDLDTDTEDLFYSILSKYEAKTKQNSFTKLILK